MSGTRAISTTSRRKLSSFFFLQGKAPKEIHAILTETLVCFLPGRAKDLSAPPVRVRLFIAIQTTRGCEKEISVTHSFKTTVRWRQVTWPELAPPRSFSTVIPTYPPISSTSLYSFLASITHQTSWFCDFSTTLYQLFWYIYYLVFITQMKSFQHGTGWVFK